MRSVAGFPGRDKSLSFHWESESSDWLALLDLPPAPTRKARQAVAAILLDASLEAHGLGRWISYSRRRGFYTGLRRYHGTAYTYRSVVGGVDALVDARLLDHEKAPAGSATGWQSSFRASLKLLELIESPPLVTYDPGETVRLKLNGHLVGYEDTGGTKKQRRNLAAFNEAIGAAELDIHVDGMVRNKNVVRIGDQCLYPAQKSLHRVFNDDWGKGGRLFGPWWQQTKSAHRRTISIDGSPTVERDYPQLHPRLLYRRAGVPLEGDAYTLDGWSRPHCKLAFNILLNAPNWHAARGAIVKETGLPPERAAQLIDAIKAWHRPIARYFHSGVGLELQNIDAGMAGRDQWVAGAKVYDQAIAAGRAGKARG